MNTKWVTNPFFIYILSFLMVFLVYSLGWSDKYPELTLSIKLFLFATFIISFFLAFILEKARKNEYMNIAPSRNRLLALGFIYFGYLLEVAYMGGIPLLQTLKGGYSYKEFTGIPTFHVILSTFNTFYGAYVFHQYISSDAAHKRRMLFFFLLTVTPHLLVLNRGAIMLTLISSFFMYFMKNRHLKIKTLVMIPFSVILIIYLFGVVGNIRYSASQEDKQFILRIGGASDEFIESSIPGEYYWGYLYIATPVGNFQNIVANRDSEFKPGNLPYFACTEPLPDFISKRALSLFGVSEKSGEGADNYLVIEALNAPTVYFRSYFLLGWTGVWLMFIHSALIMLLYPFLMKQYSRYYVAGWCCLLTIVFLNIFSNMWQAAGTILLWPLLLSTVEHVKFRDVFKRKKNQIQAR